MKLEKLNYGRNKKILLYGLMLGVGLTIGIGFNTSMAKYKVTESIPIAKGKITNYKVPDLNVVAMYQQGDSGYQEINDVPASGYTLNTTESYCGIPDTNGNIVKDSTIPMEYKDGKVYIGVSKKRTKCYLYFDKYNPYSARDFILANMPTQTTRESITGPNTASTTGIIYKADDDYGTSYYFSGNPTDNWVKFAGFYWRIIRINGDNTIRMVYQGTAANTTGTGTQTTTKVFNSSYNNNMYVGYMYTSNQVHGNGTNSTIKGELDTWYNNNIPAADKAKVNSNVGFCNDREPSTTMSSSNGSGGTGTTTTYYGAFIRMLNSSGSWANPQVPTYKCKNASDVFKVPVGLITADEVVYGGGFGGSGNSSYYLYTGQNYWTMSPYYFRNGDAWVSDVYSNGGLSGNRMDYTLGVRPVINLRADTQFSQGNGTADNPYIVE